MSTSVSVAIKNSLVREGVRRILSDSWFEIVESVDDLRKLDPKLQSAPGSHILVMDRSQLGENGAATVAGLLRRFSRTRIVALVDSFDFEEMAAIYAAGAYAYFLDQVPYQSLVAMMQMVSIGQKAAPPQIIDLLQNIMLVADGPAQEPAITRYNLNERELTVLASLELGLPNKAISRELEISESAVKATIKAILKKLGVRNRTQAAVMAREMTVQQQLPGQLPRGSEAAPDATHPGYGLRDGLPLTFDLRDVH